MASLSNTKISDTYPLLLKIETNGVDGTLRSIEDGDGTTSALKISSGAIQVDNIKVDGNAITSTDTDGNIDLTPNGSGEVNISKVDIDSGAIDGVSISATTLTASGDVNFDSNTLFVDASEDAVGIGTNSPATATNVLLTVGDTSLGYAGMEIRGGTNAESWRLYSSFDGNNDAIFGLFRVADSSYKFQVGESGNATFTGSIIIDADDKALVLGADQDASIWATDVGNVYIGSGQDYSLSSSDTEGWFNFKVGTSAESFLNIVAGEGGASSLYMTADQADDNADRWRLQSDTSGNFSISTFSSGSYASAISINSSGNVGIKTNSPGGVLQIDSALGAPSDLGNYEEYHLVLRDSGGNTNDAVGMLFSSSADTYGGSAIVHYDNGAGGQGDLVFYTKQSTSAEPPVEVMRLDDSGNIGIGTISPSAKLHVAGGAGNDVEFHLGDADGDRAEFIYRNDADFEIRSTASTGNFELHNEANRSIIFNTNGSERMRIVGGGNIGIGETSPLATLHVRQADSGASVHGSADQLAIENSSNAGLSILSGTSGEGAIYFGDSGDNDIGRIRYNHNGNSMDFKTNTSVAMTIDSSGNVGIGEDSPTGLLELKGSGNTNKYLTLDNATGNNFIQFGADNGAYACMWTEYGSGDLYIGTGVKPVGTNTNAFYSSYGGGNISRTAIVMDAFGDQGIKFHTASESTVAKDSAVTNDERMRLEHSGNLVMQNKTNGLANNIKFAGSATYANGAYTSHSLSGSSALVLITNHTNDCGVLAHMDYEHATVTFLANPAGSDTSGFNNAASGDTIRVYKSAGSFSFTIKNDSTASKAIGVGIISMHES